jgi:hypothetical protein
MRRFTPGKIVIHCFDSLDTNFNHFEFWRSDESSQIKDLFSGVGQNLLTINCKSPSDYTPISEGEGATISDGLVSTRFIVETKRLGFRFKVRDRRSDLRIAIEELIELSIDSRCDVAIPIQIDDYCYLKNRADRQRGYRIRIGFFVESLSGLQGQLVRGVQADCENPLTIELDNSDRFENGFEFKFMEVERSHYSQKITEL